jgi:nucleolar protein 53
MRPLRIDQILGERTAIHALGRPHSNVSKKQPVSKATKVLVKKLAKSKSSSKSAGTVIDIWSAGIFFWILLFSIPVFIGGFSFLLEPEVVGSPVADVIKEIVQPPPVKAPKTLKSLPPVATAIPAVELPHPGISYQPSEAEHQEAIELAAQTEIERLDKLQAAADSGPLKKIILAVQNLDAHATMDVDLPSEDEEENMKQEDHVFVKEEPKRKTKVERNRDKRRREAQLALQKSRERKALYQQIDL